MQIHTFDNKKKFQKKNDLYFSRFEIKYILTAKTSAIIQKIIKDFMILDGYAKFFSDNQYFVRSLYFDNENYDNFKEKVDGLKIRHKFRIRTYSKEKSDSSIIYLEKKGRFNERTYKIRNKIEFDQLNTILNDSDIFKLKKNNINNILINQFIIDYFKKKIKPQVIIDYYRKPFINKNGNYFRLTFDNNLSSTISKSLFYPDHQSKKTIPGYEILEVKFDRTIPPWFQKVIQSFELKRLSVSKYVLGCETSKLAYDYEGR